MPSFGDEVGRLIPHMRRFARALLRGHSAQVADDLVQETIVMAMRAERIARGTHLRAWCFANLVRVHRQRDQLAGPENARRASASECPGADVAMPRGTLAFMPKEIARLDSLPPESREVLLLVVLVGMNYAQVAETLHMTVETVMARLDIARTMLMRGQRVPVAQSGPGGSQRHARSAQYLHVIK